jgi:hypothetical protein
MDHLPSELHVSKTRQLKIIRKLLHGVFENYEKLYYFFIFDISKPNGIVDRFTEAREEPIDDALLQKYGFNTDRPQTKENSLATWINACYYKQFIDGEILRLIQFEIEDVNDDGSPEYKTFISRQ